MKVLVLGVFKDGTGYGHYCTHLIRSLMTTDVDLAIRHVRLSQRDHQTTKMIEESLPGEFQALEKKSLQDVDIVIQNVLPDFFIKTDRALSIGVTMYETNMFRKMEWIKRCNEMDFIFVPSPSTAMCFQDSGIRPNKVKHMPIGINVEELRNHNNKFDLGDLVEEDTKVFYFIGDLSLRKFLRGLLQAYYYEFDAWEKVCLFIKGYMTGNYEEDSQRLQQYITEIKKQMNIADYPPVLAFGGYSSEEEILSIHERGDFFITGSRGESLCLDALTALAKGKPIVVPDAGGFQMYADDTVGRVVKTVPSPVIGMIDQAPEGLYTGKELWQEPLVYDLARAMREVYEMNNDVTGACREKMDGWTYKEAGIRIKALLEKCLCQS